MPESLTPNEPFSDNRSLGAEELIPLVYNELRRLAQNQLHQQSPGQTLQATALVHEAYIKLVGHDQARWKSRRQFLAYASEAMRRILIDQARKKLAARRGGGAIREDLPESRIESPQPTEELLRVSDALELLANEDSESAELIKLRYFAGFNMSEAASIMGLNLRAAERLWTYARAHLKHYIIQST